MTTSREAARFMNNYARSYSAGAFATPTAAEIDQLRATGEWLEWDGFMAATRTLTRDTVRSDFTGRRYGLPAGSRLITHLAAAPDAELPDLREYDYIFSYVEDANVASQLRTQGRNVYAIRVSAASEIISCRGPAGGGYAYLPADCATLARIPFTVAPSLQDRVLAEVNAVTGWTDDFPYYSDGSWSALSLRGFNPADPAWGIKPAEMSKTWWAEHPEAVQYDKCDWTVLADHCPATVALVDGISWFGQLERVRLLRMAGHGGKGSLSRHCDITDRAAGTRDGQIVRFHIPLITYPEVTMSAWNLRGERFNVHLPPWSMWYLDARKPHAVDNRSGEDRIHLVIDVVADHNTRYVLGQSVIKGMDAAA